MEAPTDQTDQSATLLPATNRTPTPPPTLLAVSEDRATPDNPVSAAAVSPSVTELDSATTVPTGTSAPRCVPGEEFLRQGQCERCIQECLPAFELCGRCTATTGTQCVNVDQLATNPVCGGGGPAGGGGSAHDSDPDGDGDGDPGRSTTIGDGGGDAAGHNGWWVVVVAVLVVLVGGMFLARSRWRRSKQQHDLEVAEFNGRVGATVATAPGLVSNPMFAAPRAAPPWLPDRDRGPGPGTSSGLASAGALPNGRQLLPTDDEDYVDGHHPQQTESDLTAGYKSVVSQAFNGAYEVPVAYVRVASGIDAAHLYDVPVEAFGSGQQGSVQQPTETSTCAMPQDAYGAGGQRHGTAVYATAAQPGRLAGVVQAVQLGGSCTYRSALDGLVCQNSALGWSAHCHRHACPVRWCSRPKPSRVQYCEEHTEADA